LALVACGRAEPAAPATAHAQYSWDSEQLTATIRVRLLDRGFASTDIVQEVTVWPPPDHPDALLVPMPPHPPIAETEWLSGAWLTAGGCGRWWVWEDGSVSPVDDATRDRLIRLLTLRHWGE
jgi:hypothetical protein